MRSTDKHCRRLWSLRMQLVLVQLVFFAWSSRETMVRSLVDQVAHSCPQVGKILSLLPTNAELQTPSPQCVLGGSRLHDRVLSGSVRLALLNAPRSLLVLTRSRLLNFQFRVPARTEHHNNEPDWSQVPVKTRLRG